MWVSELLQLIFIEDDMKVRIQLNGVIVASGRWYQDQILDYSEHRVLSFAIDFQKNVVIIRVDGDLEL